MLVGDVDLLFLGPWGKLACGAAILVLILGQGDFLVVLLTKYTLTLLALYRVVQRNCVTYRAGEQGLFKSDLVRGDPMLVN